jgi:hypothetical protein
MAKKQTEKKQETPDTMIDTRRIWVTIKADFPIDNISTAATEIQNALECLRSEGDAVIYSIREGYAQPNIL